MMQLGRGLIPPHFLDIEGDMIDDDDDDVPFFIHFGKIFLKLKA